MASFHKDNIHSALGTSLVEGDLFVLGQKERRRHVYTVGKTGSGKTTLMENLILQDIAAGRGVCLIDPHGDLSRRVANAIPRHRINETIYFDPTDREFPIGFNPLSAVGAHERELTASSIVSAFKGLWIESWGEWLEYLLKNAVMAMLYYPAPGLSLAALPRMLLDPVFRNHVLKYCEDREVLRFWKNFFGELSQRAELDRVSSTLNKAGKLVLSPSVRNIIGQNKSGFDFKRVLDNEQILIVNLSKGLFGSDNANLLGSLLVSHIVRLTNQRAAVPEYDRVDHHLYIDEFQNFTTREFENILSESRKYRLNLMVGHQYLEQIDEQVLSAILGNVGTLCLFSISSTDAKKLACEFAPIASEKLVDSGRGRFWVRSQKDGMPQDVSSIQGLPPESDSPHNSFNRVLNNSRHRFATPRKKVEDRLERWNAKNKMPFGY